MAGMDKEGCDGIGEIANLAKVELGVFLVGNTFYLDERGVWAGVALGTLVAEDAALGVESERQGISGGRPRWSREAHPAKRRCIHCMGCGRMVFLWSFMGLA